MENNSGGQSRLPKIALGFDIAALGCFLLGLGCFYTFILFPLSLLFFLATVVLPFGAIIAGICALCLGKKEIGAKGIAMSVAAIVIPVVTVIVLVILFSTGVAYIRWM